MIVPIKQAYLHLEKTYEFSKSIFEVNYCRMWRNKKSQKRHL